MSGKLIVLITGANQGIGYHVAQQLAATGNYIVLLGSRSAEKGQKALGAMVADKAVQIDESNIEPIQIDVHYDGSIEAAEETIEAKYGHLDILLNNAGIAGGEFPGQGASLREQYLAIYSTNVFGQAMCTEIFQPLLRKSKAIGGKRIIFTSASLGSLTLSSDPDFTFPVMYFPVYRSSKTALNMLAIHYAAVLGEDGFSVCVVCPGFCETALNGYTGTKAPSEGAKAIVATVEAPAGKIHGQFMHGEVGNGTYPW